jgi:hypothetical protein
MRQILTVGLMALALFSCGDGESELKIHWTRWVASRIFSEHSLERILLLGSSPLVCQRFPRFIEPFGAYQSPWANHQWFAVKQSEGGFSTKLLFDRYHVVKSIGRCTTKNESFVFMWVENHTPSEPVSTEDIQRMIDPPKNRWFMYPDGRRERDKKPPYKMVKAKSGKGYVLPDGVTVDKLPLFESQVRSVGRMPPGSFKASFLKVAPYPHIPPGYRLAVPSEGFKMWENAGRQNAPAMKYFVGNGIQIQTPAGAWSLTTKSGLPSNRVSFFLMASSAKGWLGFYDHAPIQLDFTMRKINVVDWGRNKPSSTSMMEVADGDIIIGTFSEGVWAVDGDDLVGGQIKSIPACRISDMRVENNRVWVTSNLGLYRLVCE